MFTRAESPQARADRLERLAIERYLRIRPLAGYRTLWAVVADACRVADATGRLDEALRRQRVCAPARARVR